MRTRVMWTLRAMVLAMAVIGLMVTGAQAHLVEVDSGNDLATGDDAELALVQSFDASVFLLEKIEGDTGGTEGSFTATWENDASSGQVEWDLTGTGLLVNYVLVVDGQVGTGGDGKWYILYRVTTAADPEGEERLTSDGPQAIDLPEGAGGISHVSFFGVEGTLPPVETPEPTALLLLGVGLVGTTLLRRKAR